MSYPILRDVLQTSVRWSIGMALGSLCAVILYLFGLPSRSLRPMLVHGSNFVRAIPVIAMAPVYFHHFSVREPGKYLMIALATSLPIYTYIAHQIDLGSSQELIFSAGKLNRVDMLRWIHLPMLTGALVGGIRVAIGIGWISTVAAESLGVIDPGLWNGGLGIQILNFAQVQDWNGIYLYLVLFGILGLCSAQLYEYSLCLLRRTTGVNFASAGDRP